MFRSHVASRVAPEPSPAPEVDAATDAPHGSHTRSVQTTWTYTLGSIVFILVAFNALLIFAASQVSISSRSPLDVLAFVLFVVSAATQVRYCWFLRAGLAGGLPAPLWTIALVAPAVALWLLGVFISWDGVFAAMPLWLAASLIASLLPRRQRWSLLIGAAVLAIALPALRTLFYGAEFYLIAGPDRWLVLFYAAFLPVMVLTSLWWWQIVVQLDQHRRVAAELAVIQERLRFAADLHDVQGHHLQVIALKAELAERMLEIDPAAASALIRETRTIAKQALEETRSLVAGYHEGTLENELENAREVLTAAGAQCSLERDELPGDPETRRAFAMAVREATTNILRHSTATSASLSLRSSTDGCTLVVSNNGIGRADAGSTPGGTGLNGLRDRFAALGGTVESSVDHAHDRFELRVWTPMRKGGSV